MASPVYYKGPVRSPLQLLTVGPAVKVREVQLASEIMQVGLGQSLGVITDVR